MSSSATSKESNGASKSPAADAARKDGPEENNDLVVREGFPALRLPGGGGPNIQDDEPLPRHKFWGNERAFKFGDHLETLWSDCETVFTARTRQDDEAYSAGVTYFLPCQMKPRCAMEALVMSIFSVHTENLDKSVYLPQQSGAEWWTLVMDDDAEEESEERGEKQPPATRTEESDEDEGSDEVGLHFDADYGLEAQAPGFLLHPRLATVTYLSDFGAPTIVLDLKSPPPMDTEKKSMEGSIRTGWISVPKIGKHIAFDGRLLHGAPATFFPGNTCTISPVSTEPPTKKAKQQTKRITLLVNIWLNHCPLDAEPMDEDLVQQLKTPWKSDDGDGDDNSFKPLHTTLKPLDLDSPVKMKQMELSASKEDPAGSEEVVLCGRHVTVSFGATMEDFHAASRKDGFVELSMGRDVVSLEVGDEIEEEENGNNDDE